DVRVIATTNEDLEEAIREKRFRQDLYYRLAVLNIHIPPLREHSEDIPEIADYFVKQLCRKPIIIPDNHMKKLMRYPWPGNVRELRNVIERAALLLQGDEIKPADLLLQSSLSPPLEVSSRKSLNIHDILPLEEVKRRHVLSALRACSDNKSLTARSLGISLSTLKRKLKEMKIS
ncbi:MAG: sigma-54-dependent Fis family transcriptional regulator, partial [Desulfobacteraceae bacterium]